MYFTFLLTLLHQLMFFSKLIITTASCLFFHLYWNVGSIRTFFNQSDI